MAHNKHTEKAAQAEQQRVQTEQKRAQEYWDRIHREYKKFEFRVYTTTALYAGDVELLTTIQTKFRNVTTDKGRVVSPANGLAEEYARNIGMFGITVEQPDGMFTFYPPDRIHKVEYNQIPFGQSD